MMTKNAIVQKIPWRRAINSTELGGIGGFRNAGTLDGKVDPDGVAESEVTVVEPVFKSMGFCKTDRAKVVLVRSKEKPPNATCSSKVALEALDDVGLSTPIANMSV
jgi:hypothetical protein